MTMDVWFGNVTTPAMATVANKVQMYAHAGMTRVQRRPKGFGCLG
jgi:hypothetical protein